MTAVPGTAESSVRFRFGENWQSFVATVDEQKIAGAEQALLRLFPGDEIRATRFLDIGCGSGLSALAAFRLGASSVEAVDFDAASVAATNALFAKFAPEAKRSVRQASVFDLSPDRSGAFDIVYSWGVLHHTGDMWGALDRACGLAGDRGRLAVALYRRTPFCGFWAREKRFYAQAGPAAQTTIRSLYKAAYCAGVLATGRNPAHYIAGYRTARGMDWHHDVHDWLGGYPYQSADPAAVAAFLRQRGFAVERTFAHAPIAFGIFGSHCDEYVAGRAIVHATNS